MGIFSIFKRRRRPELEQKGPAGQKRRQKQAPNAADDEASSARRMTWRGMVACMVLLIWAATVFTSMQRTTPAVDFVVEQTVPNNIYADVDFEYVDVNATEALRDKKAQLAPHVYVYDRAVTDSVIKEFQAFFEFLNAWDPERPREVPAANLDTYLSMGPNNLLQFKDLLTTPERQTTFIESLKEVLRNRVVTAEDKTGYDSARTAQIVDESGRRQTTELGALHTPESAALQLMAQMAENYGTVDAETRDRLASEIVTPLLQANTTYNFEATLAEREAARAKEPDVLVSVQRGKIIVSGNRKITPQDLKMLEAHAKAAANAYDSDAYWRQASAMMILSLLTVIVWALILHTVQPKVTHAMSRVALIGVAVALNIVLIWGVQQLMLLAMHGSQTLVYAALPLLFAAVLLSLLLGPAAGMTAGILVAVQAAFTIYSHGAPLHVIVLGVAQSVVGALAVRSVRTRIQTFRLMLYAPIAIFLVEVAFLVMTDSPPLLMAKVFGVAVANCLVMTILVNLLLPIAEILFGITTNITLLELSDLNHPLLKRLQLEAPGTFHHTMNVATLAEHAAEAVGANTLQCRVASYFHDVGKLSNPAYFTENNIDQKNQHEDLSPHMSARIIVNHVKEGLELARQYKLRKPIRDAIATHHGTSLVFFFYHRAKQEAKEGNGSRLEESSFRYPGPLPRSPECTIISIADSCEAASRSLPKPTPQKIDALVNELVRNRILDGQFDDSEMTMDELNRVVATIKKTLRTMRHARIAYPKDEEESGGKTPPSPPLERTRKMTPDQEETSIDLDSVSAPGLSESKAPKPAVAAPPDAGPQPEPVRVIRPGIDTVPDLTAPKPPAGMEIPETVRDVMAPTPEELRAARLAASEARETTELPAPAVSPAKTDSPTPEPDSEDEASTPEAVDGEPDPTAPPPKMAGKTSIVKRQTQQADDEADSDTQVNVSLTNQQTDLPVADSSQLIRLLRRSVELAGLCENGNAHAEVSFSLVDLETIEDVNMRHLEHEGPTDVITFDYREDEGPAMPEEDATLGEVMVCPAMALRQAPDHEQDVATEMVLYLVHGILHLSGHDDVQESARPAMRQAEQDMLSRLREEFNFTELFGEPTGEAPV